MRISLNWLKKYVKVPVSDEELVRLIGARLVEVEGVIDETHKYDNIYVVRVESCEKIPDTHLTLCQIDVGGESTGDVAWGAPAGAPATVGEDATAGPVERRCAQVVCGAPNVRAGMLAVWIAPGAIVPASVHEDAPFVIGKRKMRGYESNGMLAGADELDFGDDHSGIVEIDPEFAKPGDLIADVFELNDLILEIENKSLTHRPDCFGMIGFAREVSGILGEEFAEPVLVQNPSGSLMLRFVGDAQGSFDEPPEAGKSRMSGARPWRQALQISIKDPNICQRYSALILEKHGELKSKYLTWVDTILSKSGMKPINPIVDATNYLMLLTGQPLHAFDYDKFITVGGSDSPEIQVRLAQAGEKLTLLDGKEIELGEDDIVICSNKTPVALAGAMGGESTMIDEKTKKIIIESATFSLYNLRKTQMTHGIFSEAITRFTKGQPPYQTLSVAEACAEMLEGGFRVLDAADEYPAPEQPIAIKVTVDEINGLLGTKYSESEIRRTLEHVGFRVDKRNRGLQIGVPEWRTDVHIKEDVIEEVGRLLGYDNIPLTLPLHGTAERNKMLELKSKVRDILSKYGANELLTYSFVSGRLLEKVGQEKDESYKIVNSISPELQYVRQSIVPSLLEKAYVNQKIPINKFAMFEMNKVYSKKWGKTNEKVPVEKMSIGLVLAERKNTETAYYKAKMYAAKLLRELGIEAEFVTGLPDEGYAKPFEAKRAASIMVNNDRIGVVGEFKNSVRNEFKLAAYLAGFEISLEALVEMSTDKRKIDLVHRKTEDLTVTTDKTYAEALMEVRKKYPTAEISPLSIYQAVGQKTRNISFRIAI